MATFTHNPTFKVPAGPAPRFYRSPSPPHAFVEPLSPTKPKALEPQFNYPALDPSSNFSVRAQKPLDATPRSYAYSGSHKSNHKRTSSTIDTLAEAALAVSPSYLSQATCQHIQSPQVQGLAGRYDTSEPPHKRARSEVYPSPQVGPTASRPATSYGTGNGWSYHDAHQISNGYDSRVEEAALLLNFRTGGMSPPNARPIHRPHANSFPRDAFLSRPAEMAAPPPLLEPFMPEASQHHKATLPSPQQTIGDAGPSPEASDVQPDEDVGMSAVYSMKQELDETKPSKEPQQTQTPPEESKSRAESTDVTSSEAAEVVKPRRGWPKGKPRNPGARKINAEKNTTRRNAAKKKTSDAAKRSTASKVRSGTSGEVHVRRRKSTSDVQPDGPMGCKGGMLGSRSQSVPRTISMSIREVSPVKANKRHAKVAADIVCAGCSTTRESVQANSELDEWISCNGCKRWFHIDCAGFQKIHEVRDVDKYFCAGCEPEHGKTTHVRKSTRAHTSVDYAELQRGNLKTSEDSVEHHYIQPIKDGKFQFDPESFPRMQPDMVTRDFFEKSNTFVEPICIPAEWNPRPWAERDNQDSTTSKAREDDEGKVLGTRGLYADEFEYDTVDDNGQDRLEMVMPEGLTVRHVCGLVGADTPLDVIDVKTQNSGSKWTLARWADYYEEESGEKAIRNVISLEVSQTKLGRLLQRPKVVRDIDLQDDVWPQEETDKGRWPKVQFYCLMSVADSYTDFHIDFGGSSVYYHILRGKKTFFFIPPKPKNLKAYEDWNNNPQQNFTFLPDITKECYRVDLNEGDTMLIPSGWIHAVWTPADSLVIGGNFLTRMSYKNQFRVVDIEKANHTPMKFRYPYFQKIMWYTAIEYLKTDPLPHEVSQLFYDGKRFERQIPTWQDFDGDVSANDDRPGAHNTRYYSQAELDGLPELVSFIYRTVMLVMGRIEGTSADQQKRVNASIPKGHGEPLEVAKTFALWVAWKRGNEDPPAWAHPDAELQLHKEERSSKKLSARALKGLERKEAIEAWRLAPDRQSERVMSKQVTNGSALATSQTSTPVHAPPPSQHTGPSQPSQPHLSPAHNYPSASPVAITMDIMPGHYMSTPKTSVLGPKRVACDTCRKRRIRCKHKDIVVQAPTVNPQQRDGAYHEFQTPLGSALHDNITVTPAKSQSQFINGMSYDMSFNGSRYVNGHNPQPGTNAYVTANIPMTMNGVPIFGDVSKRGRSKACFECRKSKRRCVHDESGNVDPLKAAETPVPRGSNASKKRPFGDDDGLSQRGKEPRASTPGSPPTQYQRPTPPASLSNAQTNGPSFQIEVRPPSRHEPPVADMPHVQQQPPIDPSLFSMYPEPSAQSSVTVNGYPYSTTEQRQPQFDFQSLEQIANEVLDMNGRQHEDAFDAMMRAGPVVDDIPVFEPPDSAHATNETARPDENAHDHITTPKKDRPELAMQSTEPTDSTQIHAIAHRDNKEANQNPTFYHGLPPMESTVELNAASNGVTDPSPDAYRPIPSSDTKSLPLYEPPAPPSQSPETRKRQPLLVNGPAAHPRKQEFTRATARHSVTGEKGANGTDAGSQGVIFQEMDDERTARLLRQEDLDLRTRT